MAVPFGLWHLEACQAVLAVDYFESACQSVVAVGRQLLRYCHHCSFAVVACIVSVVAVVVECIVAAVEARPSVVAFVAVVVVFVCEQFQATAKEFERHSKACSDRRDTPNRQDSCAVVSVILECLACVLC